MIQNFSTLLLKHTYLRLQKLFHKSSYNCACHYDTLRLKRSCSSKEIRDSFIKLSKEHHPDINKSPNAHKEFLKIQEAYNVLSKPQTRASYDLGMPSSGSRVRYDSASTGSRPNYGPYSDRRYTTPPFGRNPWDDPSFYHNRDRSQDHYYESKPYYGIKGVKRVSNETVAFYIIVMTIVMFFAQMIAVRQAVSGQQEIMNMRTMQTQKLLNEIKERAERNGNSVQIEIHRKQLEEEQLRAEQAGRQK